MQLENCPAAPGGTRTGVRISLMDGFVAVDGSLNGLEKKLRYFHRELVQTGHGRKMSGRQEDLFSIDGNGTLVTLPGFAHRVIEHFRASGVPFSVDDRRTPMPSPDYAKAFEGLRDYQIPLAGKLLRNGGGILKAGTGIGKTAVSAAIIRAFPRDELVSRKTPLCVFACPDKDINRKNRDELERFLPGRDVGMVMSGANKPSDDVVCCTLDSLDRLDPDSVGILICDEMHTASSQDRQESISRFAKAARWGVSATPTGRFDGGDIVAEGLFGPIVAEFSYADGVRSGALVPITVYWVPAPEPPDGLISYSRLRTRDGKIRRGSVANPVFNQMVADILDNVPDSMQTLCMLQYIEQMSGIHRRCHKSGYVHAETSQDKLAPYPTIDAISPARRKEIYSDFREKRIGSLICTHVYRQGVDFPDLSVVVNAGGGGSDILAKQVPGRASRAADGKDEAFVIDFTHEWDREDPIARTGKPGPLLSADRQRRKAYSNLGFRQVQCNSILDIPFLEKAASETRTADLAKVRRNLLF